MGEAVTILIRSLGYSSQQAGAVWPQGYMDLADSIGLSQGLSAGAFDCVSRAQAAQLFVNALKCKTAGGAAYYKSLGTVVEDAIILAVGVETDDASARGAVRTSSNKNSEAYLPAKGDGNVAALRGKRGALVLNDREEIVTFIPDDSSAVSLTLSGDAQPSYVKSGSRQYTISADTPVYTSAGGTSQTYLSAYSTLTSGSQITLYSEKGKIVAVYATSSATSIDSDAVVVMGRASVASFHQLTGGASDFSIVKNRQSIRLSDIREYDVVTYDSMTNTLMVSDLRLSCIYGDASPNAAAPQSLKVAGTTLPVLESAWETCAGFKPGDSVTLLLTADGKVAGMADAGKVRSNAVGMAASGGVNVFRPDGGVLELKGTLGGSSADNQLVNVSADRSRLILSRLPDRAASAPFQVEDMRLGSYTVTAGVRIYEQVRSGAMVAVDLAGLADRTIPAERVVSYHLNSSDMVDYIVLSDVTGNAYDYGMMVAKTVTVPGGGGEPDTTETSWTLVRGSGDVSFTSSSSYSGRSGDMVGVVPGKPLGEASGSTISAIVQLTEVKNVKAGDFFESQGVFHVTAGGRTYRVAGDVECFRSLGGSQYGQENWLTQATGAQRLEAIRAYGSSFTVYVDPIGQQVRVIQAN